MREARDLGHAGGEAWLEKEGKVEKGRKKRDVKLAQKTLKISKIAPWGKGGKRSSIERQKGGKYLLGLEKAGDDVIPKKKTLMIIMHCVEKRGESLLTWKFQWRENKVLRGDQKMW